MKHFCLPFPLLTLSVLVWQLFTGTVYAQWSTNPNVNNAMCTEINDQTEPTIVSDGSGSAIIVWTDYRAGIYSDIYAQCIGANGILRWTIDGVAICSAADYQLLPTVAGDGVGGAIVAWVDNRYGNNYDIYAQRIDSSGITQWQTDGVSICTETNYQSNPKIVADGSGGAIIVWQDKRSINYDIYAQHINTVGEVQWNTGGIMICNEVGSQEFPKLVSDEKGGVIITWIDHRSGNYDIYAQLVDSSGLVQWELNGVAICRAPGEQSFSTLVSDGSNGAIITWEDHRNPPADIYAQRINTSGVVQWATDGVAISALAYAQRFPAIVSDGSGGAIITWQVNSSGNDYDIYVQHIDSTGTVQWTVNGMAICTSDHNQQEPTVVSYGSGGAIIAWIDQRSGTNYDIYAQRIDASGLIKWEVNGVAITTATYDQIFPSSVADADGGAIITWQDYRVAYTDSVDIYAQQVDTDGNLGVVTGISVEPSMMMGFALLQNYPNPFNPTTTIRYALPKSADVQLKVYNLLGHLVRTLLDEEKPAGNYTVTWDGKDNHGALVASGVYIYSIKADRFSFSRKMVVLK